VPSVEAWRADPIAGRLGAEICGIDLTEDLDDERVAFMRESLLRHRVIFFRNQHLDAAQHLAFADRFGLRTKAHPTLPALSEAHADILDLDSENVTGRANNWHTDVTFAQRPPFGSILRALRIPEYGGDTIWANTAAAYEDLPSRLSELADTLWAVHTNVFDYAATPAVGAKAANFDQTFRAVRFETEHPVVRVHPETREPALLLGSFARRITGLSATESSDLLRIFQSYVTRPENTVRWRWRAGDVAFWDNRATQHYALYDYAGRPRRVQRVTLAGDVPAAIDGRQSISLAGDLSDYIPSPPPDLRPSSPSHLTAS
jgi:alpha-ketoglutarate-dependent taurine dioxygenase